MSDHDCSGCDVDTLGLHSPRCRRAKMLGLPTRGENAMTEDEEVDALDGAFPANGTQRALADAEAEREDFEIRPHPADTAHPRIYRPEDMQGAWIIEFPDGHTVAWTPEAISIFSSLVAARSAFGPLTEAPGPMTLNDAARDALRRLLA